MTKLFLALAPVLSLSGIAAAEAPTPIRITLATPVAQPGPVQGHATRWSCAGTSCTGPELTRAPVARRPRWRARSLRTAARVAS